MAHPDPHLPLPLPHCCPAPPASRDDQTGLPSFNHVESWSEKPTDEPVPAAAAVGDVSTKRTAIGRLTLNATALVWELTASVSGETLDQLVITKD